MAHHEAMEARPKGSAVRDFNKLVSAIQTIDGRAKVVAGRSVDRVLTMRNWLIGACIIEYEQNGEDRGAYGDRLIPELARCLVETGATGLGERNLKNCRQITLSWPALEIRQTVSAVFGTQQEKRIRQTVSAIFGGSDVRRILQTVTAESAQTSEEDEKRQTASGEFEEVGSMALGLLADGDLSFPSLAERAASAPRLDWQDQEWLERLFSTLSFSQLLELSRIDDHLKRTFYELECLKSGWSVRELKRQINSMLYERVGLSKDKAAVMAMAEEGTLVETPSTVVRDPYVLEFLGVREPTAWSESDLEQALIDNLRQFIHELGHDFCFVDRQHRITVGGRHHFLDLLFYHRALRALVAIDLKIGAFKHEYAGQMNFYLSYLAENLTHPDESPPVGIVLCADKDAAEVHYATASLERSVFVSRYLVQLPSEEQLLRWLDEEREVMSRMESRDKGKGES